VKGNLTSEFSQFGGKELVSCFDLTFAIRMDQCFVYFASDGPFAVGNVLPSSPLLPMSTELLNGM
jgi:hypothetical protein